MRTLIFRALATLVLVAAFATAAHAASYSGIVIDAKTGKVLYSHRADAKAYPASLAKMMTLYLLFDAMEAGRISKSTRITVSARAASMQPSKLGIKPGGSLTAEQAILALVTKSANDVAVAVAEHIAGSEPAFAVRMTRQARDLGLKNTTFRNASGLPDAAQVTTARDMAMLGIALREHFPQYYRYFSTRSFAWGRTRMANHNRLLGRFAGMDGIKTGYTRASGFNLVSSVKTGNRSVVAAVLGEQTGKSRNARMHAILKTNLAKASTAKGHLLIARAPAVPLARPEQSVGAAQAPVPLARDRAVAARTEVSPETRRIEMAHGFAADDAPQRSQANAVRLAPSLIAAIEGRLRTMSASRLPVPRRGLGQQRSGRTVDPLRTAAVAEQRSAQRAAEHTAQQADLLEAAPTGWQIQIAAVPQLEAARDVLRQTRGKLPGLLAKYADYTEPVVKNGTTLYRARFAGFVSKEQAWDACSQLKKRKVGCLAIEN